MFHLHLVGKEVLTAAKDVVDVGERAGTSWIRLKYLIS